MKKTLQPIGYMHYYHTEEFYAISFEKIGGDYFIHLERYTGYNYKSHTLKLHNVFDDPFFNYNGKRFHVADFSEIKIDDGGRVQLTGNCLNVWDYIENDFSAWKPY